MEYGKMLRVLSGAGKGRKDIDMKIRNSFFAGLCSAALAANLLPVSAEGAKTDFYEATSDNVRILGRTVYNEDALWFANSAAGVEFKATGSQVTFNINVSGDPTRVGVYLNGQLYQRGVIGGKSASARKASITVPLAEGENTVKLLKLSEGPQSTIAIDSIETDEGGTLSPTAAKEKKLEFIGDSITCGYGIDLPLKDPETKKNNSFSTKSEDASKTYAFQIAEMLDADVNLFAGSGYGIWCSYGGGRENVMGNFYTKCGPNTWNSISASSYTLIQSFDWDFSNYQPDCVVINLGTNDWSYFSSHGGEVGDFEDSYIDFLGMVRANNPNAKIVCTLGMMGADLYPNVESAVDYYKEDTGDSEVYLLELAPINASTEGYGVDYHPMPATNTRVANDELGPFIADLMGWELGEMPDDGTLTLTPDNLVTGEYHEQPADTEPEDSSKADTDVSDASKEDVSSVSSTSASSADSSDSSSDSKDSSSSADSSKNSSAGSISSASKANNASTANSTAANNSNSNPTTGFAGGMAMIALMGGAVIISKRKK